MSSLPSIGTFNYNFYNKLQQGFTFFNLLSKDGVEHAVVTSLQRLNIPREDIFIASFVSEAPPLGSVNISFQTFELAYFDILVLQKEIPYHDEIFLINELTKQWRQMQIPFNEGYVKNLGVSNLSLHHIKLLLKICDSFHWEPPRVAYLNITIKNKKLNEVLELQQLGLQVISLIPLEGSQGLQLRDINVNNVVISYFIEKGIICLIDNPVTIINLSESIKVNLIS